MNLYLISQNVNKDYDTHDSAVVVAASYNEARHTHPSSDGYKWINNGWRATGPEGYADVTWAEPKDVLVLRIGKAHPRYKKPQSICASFNAG